MFVEVFFSLLGVKVAVARKGKSSNISSRDDVWKNPSTVHIDEMNFLSIFSSSLVLKGQVGAVGGDAIDAHRCIWPFPRGINEQALDTASCFPGVQTGLFFVPATFAVEIQIGYTGRLVYDLNVEICFYASFEQTQFSASTEIAVAAALLLSNPNIRLGQRTIFQPPVRVADPDPMDDFFDWVGQRHNLSMRIGFRAARSMWRARLLAYPSKFGQTSVVLFNQSPRP
jgi:hypothetical protein